MPTNKFNVGVTYTNHSVTTTFLDQRNPSLETPNSLREYKQGFMACDQVIILDGRKQFGKDFRDGPALRYLRFLGPKICQ